MLRRLKWVAIAIGIALAPVLATDEAAHAQRAQAVFVQHGVASWYGPGFHGRKTASGSISMNSPRRTSGCRSAPRRR